jgi:trk system potassium uptake protein TrkH
MPALSRSNGFKVAIPFTGARRGARETRAVRWRTRRDGKLSPSQFLALSFAGLVTFGTMGLLWIPGLYTGEPLHWVDALFMATSASCITGLTVVEVGTYFTPLGQAFLLLLVQLGGLGMLGLASLVIVTLNRRLSLRQDVLAGAGAVGAAAQDVPVRSLVRDVLLFTLAAEGTGFLLLWGIWAIWPPEDLGRLELAWHALFHSVSAFCNAGFSTFQGGGLMSFQNRPGTQLVLMGGIVIGGLGFLTLEELKLWVRARRQRRAFRLSLHTRLVLTMTLVLIVGGWVGLGALEWVNKGTLGPLASHDKVVNALFLSISSRTAGFNTIDTGQTLPATQFLIIILMSIGGAPGSTAGGVKVTTIGILVAMAWARLRARTSNDLWDRTIPDTTAQRAVGLFVFSFVMVTIGIAALTILELGRSFAVDIGITLPRQYHFLDYMFEATSAFNTVGMSTGPTPLLTGKGRLLLVVLMFVGRIGPLTFAAALSWDDPNQRLVKRFAQEDVVVG